MTLIKAAWYVLRMKKMHPGSPLDPNWTAAERGEAELRILDFKTTWSDSKSPVRPLLSEAKLSYVS